MAAFCSHEFVAAHERLGRNRPDERARSSRTSRATSARDRAQRVASGTKHADARIVR
jgi:hypothetical protein